jgi:two-component system sensor histidine kinase DesK
MLPWRGFAVPAGQRLPYTLSYGASAAAIGLLVYGLTWLAGLAIRMESLSGELARMAVVQERLRIAQDVHDLLGLGLSAIALKADLAGRLIGRDDRRAAAELEEMSRVCAQARAEVRLVTGDGQRLSLAAEVTAATQILVSAGIEVRARMSAGPLPAVADDVLAPVLREAVTNILRHSTAKTCTIEAMSGDGTLRLRVSNDGVPERTATGSLGGRAAADDRSGSGLANVTARVHAAGGQLTSCGAGGRFDLVAAIRLGVPAH